MSFPDVIFLIEEHAAGGILLVSTLNLLAGLLFGLAGLFFQWWMFRVQTATLSEET